MKYGEVKLTYNRNGKDSVEIETFSVDEKERVERDEYSPHPMGFFHYPANIMSEEEAVEILVAHRIDSLEKSIKTLKNAIKNTKLALEKYKERKK